MIGKTILICFTAVLVTIFAGPATAADKEPACYNKMGAVAPCPDNGNLADQVEAQQSGAMVIYRDNGDGTVRDLRNHNVWQQADDGVARDWVAGLEYCRDLSLGGNTDWRLPEAGELESVADYGRSQLTMNPVFSCSNTNYWTTSPAIEDESKAKTVGFFGGDGYSYPKTDEYLVRCVRAD